MIVWRLLTRTSLLKKQGKFLHDKLAFSEAYAYKWSGKLHSRRNNFRNRKPQTATATDYTESDSSISSLSSQVTSRSTNPRAPSIPRKRSLTGENHPTKDPKKGKKQHGKTLKTQQASRSGLQTPHWKTSPLTKWRREE